MENFFIGKDGFTWFTGVVEDRNDPDKLGRVRVRAVGYHTDNKDEIQTEDLPWAWVLNPTTVPSMNGMGETPPFLVEGSWVLGFFRDTLFQEPIILGSLPGFNLSSPDGNKGFNDPNGIYPKTTGEVDVNRLAQGLVGDTHPSLFTRRKSQVTEVPIATKPYIPTVEDAAVQEGRTSWNELDAKSNSVSFYPFNHVHESESGHIHEIDDSPEGERLFTYHRSGSFEEIHPDGSKVVKIVGDDYEIVVGNRNCYVQGSINLTVDGNVRQLIKGDYVLEVEGDFTQKIHKNKLMKVGAGVSGGNIQAEIRGTVAENISDKFIQTVGADTEILLKGNRIENVKGDDKKTVGKNETTLVFSDIKVTALQNHAQSSISGKTTMISGTQMNIKSATEMNIVTETSLTETISNNVVRTIGGTLNDTVTGVGTITMTASGSEVNASGILLTGHTHTDPAGVAGNETSTPN